MYNEYESPTVRPRTEGNATIEYNDAKPHKGYGYRMLWGLVRRLLGFFESKGVKPERDAAVMFVDFDRDCFSNHSSTYVVCPFCPLSLHCLEDKNNRSIIKERMK